MPTLADRDLNVKLLLEKRRFERPAPIEGEAQRWTIRCMAGCGWRCAEEFQTAVAAALVAEHHADLTGHAVATEGWIKVKGPIIRSKSAVR